MKPRWLRSYPQLGACDICDQLFDHERADFREVDHAGNDITNQPALPSKKGFSQYKCPHCGAWVSARTAFKDIGATDAEIRQYQESKK